MTNGENLIFLDYYGTGNSPRYSVLLTDPARRSPLALVGKKGEHSPMKLQQGQVWKCGVEYVRIVHLERLEVRYISAPEPKFSGGKHQHTSKKDFCRLLKGATLVAPAAEKISPPPARTA